MRKFYAMISVAMVCLILSACRPPLPQPTTTPMAWPVTISARSPFASSTPIPSATPILRFTAIAQPTQQPVASVMPRDYLTPPPVPTLRFTPAITVPLPCDPRPSAAWRSWRGSEAQPVLALLTERGTLWVSTWSGVFQVDPRTGTFTRTLSFDIADGVLELFPLGEGRLWAGTDYGAFYYDGQEWSTINTSGTHSSPNAVGPYVIGIDRNGDLWAYGGDKWGQPHYYRFPGHFPPPRNGLWIATPVSSGVPQPDTCEMQRAVWSLPPLAPPYRSPEECRAIQRARHMVTVPDSIYLPTILSADRGIWWLSNREAYDQPLRLGNISNGQTMTLELPVHSVSSAAIDLQRGIWLGTEQGLLYSDGQELRLGLAGLDACLGPNWVQELVIDLKGTAWVLTSFDGVYTLPPGVVEWQHVADPTQTGQSPEPIVSIAAAAEGGIWATHGDDLFRFGGPNAMLPVQLPENCQISKLTVKAGNVWGTGGECGLLQFDVSNATWVLHRSMRVLPGQIDVGTDGTLYALMAGDLYAYTSKGQPGDSGAPIRQWIRVAGAGGTGMAADRANGVWLTWGTDLWYYNNSRVTKFSQQFEKYLVRLNVDSQNRLWINLGYTLIVYDGHSFRQVAVPMRFISVLTVAPDDRLWMYGDGKIAVYDPAADK